jgi:zinc transport system ATP-binding protein
MENIIEVSNLSFGYNEVSVLKNINFSVHKGDFLGIIGSNGAGKSTLMKLLLNILTPVSGEIKLLGENINRFKKWNEVGYISQKANSFNSSFPATVEEIVGANLFSKIGLFRMPKKHHKEMIYNALEKVDMQDYGKRQIGNLSGGQQQRVFIARAIVNNPKILFLDEPTVGIDAKSEQSVYCLLSELNKSLGLTVVMVTHDIGAITAHANRIICLGENGLLEHNPSEGITKELVTKIYGSGVNLNIHDCKNCHRKEVG